MVKSDCDEHGAGRVLTVSAGRGDAMKFHPLDALASTTSVSYRERLDRQTLDAILRQGRFDARWVGHVMTMVEETPIEMLARTVSSYPRSEQAGVIAGPRALGQTIGSDRIERWMTG